MEPDSTTEESEITNVIEDVVQENVSATRRVLKRGQHGHICSIQGCFSKMTHKRNIKRHIDNFHGHIQKQGKYLDQFGILRWICKICNKSNVNEYNFMRHFRTAHENLPESEALYHVKKKFTKMPELVYKK